FLLGGCNWKCIDVVLDALELAHKNKNGFYCVMYDVKGAYDTVDHDVLLAALRRICLPASFIELIKDSLSNLTSCVRTAYGESQSFPVTRSVRQGDPLAPLLYIVKEDMLHCSVAESSAD